MKNYLSVQEALPLFADLSFEYPSFVAESEVQGRSDAELLATFLNAVPLHQRKNSDYIDGRFEVARSKIIEAGGLRTLLNSPQEYFQEDECERIFALKEVFKRFLKEELKVSDALTSPALTRDFLLAKVRDLPHEVFGLLLLDNQHRVIDSVELFRGTIDGAAVYPREVIKTVLQHNAAAVIIYHNHPSGIAEPSRTDKVITERLRAALETVDIRLLDHIVIGDSYCDSFAERGWL